MTAFFDSFQLSVDEKGRINVPSPFRRQLGAAARHTMVVVRGTENCLWAYPLDEWERFWENLQGLPVTPANTQQKTRIASTLKLSVLDKQGRITLSPPQMQMAGIQKDVMVVGEGVRFQIWERETYERMMKAVEQTPYDTAYYDMMKEIKSLGSS